MDEEEHRQLFSLLLAHLGKVMISGYNTSLYSEMLKGWKNNTIYQQKKEKILNGNIKIVILTSTTVPELDDVFSTNGVMTILSYLCKIQSVRG